METRKLGDFQDAIHQAVDIGFSVADLLAGLFGDSSYTRSLHRNGDGTSTLSLQMAPKFKGLQIANTDTGRNAMITSCQSVASSTGLALSASTLFVPTSTVTDYSDFQKFTKGLLTAVQVPVVNPGYDVPLVALTARDFTPTSGIPLLGSDVVFDIDTTGVTLYNADPTNNSYFATFTVSTGAPNRTFNVTGNVGPNATVRLPFPDDTTGQVFAQLSAVLMGPSTVINGLVAKRWT